MDPNEQDYAASRADLDLWKTFDVAALNLGTLSTDIDLLPQLC